MESKVITKIAFVDSENNICLCDEHFYKTCSVRVVNNLACAKYYLAMSLAPDELSTSPSPAQNVFGGPVLFKNTLEHLGRLG